MLKKALPLTLVKSETLMIFNALRPKTLEENRHEAPHKLRKSSLSIVLVDVGR
jgi:hypothetical protein